MTDESTSDVRGDKAEPKCLVGVKLTTWLALGTAAGKALDKAGPITLAIGFTAVILCYVMPRQERFFSETVAGITKTMDRLAAAIDKNGEAISKMSDTNNELRVELRAVQMQRQNSKPSN